MLKEPLITCAASFVLNTLMIVRQLVNTIVVTVPLVVVFSVPPLGQEITARGVLASWVSSAVWNRCMLSPRSSTRALLKARVPALPVPPKNPSDCVTPLTALWVAADALLTLDTVEGVGVVSDPPPPPPQAVSQRLEKSNMNSMPLQRMRGYRSHLFWPDVT